MSESQPDRTPAEWAKNCLALLKEIDSGFERNRLAKGRFIEFVRTHPTGVFVSHNFIRVRDTYHLCLAVLFSKHPSETLVSPLAAGARFDHSRTIWRQFSDDLGLHRTNEDTARSPPDGVWSFGEWRRNTLDLVRQGLRVSEEHLLPHYLEALRVAAPALVTMFKKASDLVPALEQHLADGPEDSDRVRTLLLASGPHFRSDVGDLNEAGASYARLVEAGAACGIDPETIVSSRLESVSAEGVPTVTSLDALIVNHFGDFRQEAGALAALVRTAQALADSSGA